MNASGIVVILELAQLARQVRSVPEEHAIEILAPERADHPLDERMRDRGIRNGLDLLHLDYAQVGEPAMEAEHRVVIGAVARVFRHYGCDWSDVSFARKRASVDVASR